MRVTAAALSLNVPDVEASAGFVGRHLGFATEMEADGWRAADGTWRDGLLMDVLARDLEPA